MPTVAELSAKITADTKDFERGVQRAKTELRDFSMQTETAGGALTRFGQIGTAAVLGFATAAAGALAFLAKQVFDVGVEYERAMNMFQAVTGSTAETMKQAAAIAKELGADMSLPATSAGQAAQAMTELAKGGFSAQAAMDAARGTIMLAKAAMVDEAQAAGIVANAINAFGLAATEAGRVSDLLAASANASSAEITDVALALQQSAAGAHALKIPIEDLVTAIGEMANAGIKGSDAGTSLKTFMIALIPHTKQAAAAMKELGINAFDSKGHFVGLQKVIEQAAPALARMTDQQKQHAIQAAFGTDAMRAANIVLGAGVEKFKDMEKAVTKAGAAQELAAARAKGLGGAIDGLISQLETIGIEIYEKFAPRVEGFVRKIADGIGSWVEKAKGFYEAHKQDLDALGQKVQEVYDTYIREVSTASIEIGSALKDLKGSIDGFSTEHNATWKIIGFVVKSAADLIENQLRGMSAAIKVFVNAAKMLWSGLYVAFIEPIQKAFDWIRSKIPGLHDTLQEAGKSALSGWRSGIEQHSPSGFEKDLARIYAAFVDFPEKLQAQVAPKLKNAGKQMLKDMREAFNDLLASINDFVSSTKQHVQVTAEVWASLAPSIRRRLIELTEEYEKNKQANAVWSAVAVVALEKLKTAVDKIVPSFANLSTAISEVGPAFDILQSDSAALTAKMVADSEKRQARIKAEQQASDAAFRSLSDAFKDLSRELPNSWNLVIDGILNASGRVGEELLKLGLKVKGWAKDVLGVIETMPGKFGDMARGVLRTVDQWVAFFDKILGLLHRFIDSVPASVGDIIGKIFGKGGQGGTFSDPLGIIPDITIPTNKISSTIQGMSEKVKTAFGVAGAAAAGFASSLTLAANSSSKAMGFLEATISSTLAGIAAGFAFGPVAGAITAGVSLIGGIIGLFRGKSSAQKEKERLQLEQLKQDIQKGAQDVVNAALDGFNKAIEFLEKLDQFTAPKKEKFRVFFKDLGKLLDYFIELAKKWANENLSKAKEVAEAIGSVASSIAAAPAAFDAINSAFTLSDASFDVFFSNLDRFMERFFARADVWIEGTSKRAMKVADRLKSVVDLVAPFTEGLKGMVDLKPVSDEAFGVFESMLQKMVERIGAIADKFDKGWLKTLAFFSEKAQAALGLWKDAVDAIKTTTDIPVLDEAAIDAVVSGIEMFVTKLIAAAESMTNEGLAKAAAIANSVLPIAAAVKAWAEAAAVIKDYTAVANDTWDAIVGDFNRAITLINMMLSSALDFLPSAVQFEDVMKQIADHLRAGLDSLGSGLAAAASAFGGVVSAIGGGVPIGTGPGGDLGGSSFTGMSFAGGGSSTTFAPTVVVQGSLIHQDELEDVLVRVGERILRRGRG